MLVARTDAHAPSDSAALLQNTLGHQCLSSVTMLLLQIQDAIWSASLSSPTSRNTVDFSDLIWDGPTQSEKCPLVWWVQRLLELMDAVSFGTKKRRTIQIISESSKVNICDGMRARKSPQLAHLRWHRSCWKVHTGFGATYAAIHTMPFWGMSVYFRRTRPSHSLLPYNSVAVEWKSAGTSLDCLPPDLIPSKNIWHVIKVKIQQ